MEYIKTNIIEKLSELNDKYKELIIRFAYENSSRFYIIELDNSCMDGKSITDDDEYDLRMYIDNLTFENDIDILVTKNCTGHDMSKLIWETTIKLFSNVELAFSTSIIDSLQVHNTTSNFSGAGKLYLAA
ncbi:MAG: hypothetical protein ACRCX4_12025 [Bacteroidales bacterium]